MNALTAYRGMVLSHDIGDYPEGIVVPVDKPYRWTSADVIRKVKWMAVKHFGKRNLKVGHAGTLDPLATGVLNVCIGKATRLADEIQKYPKQYLAGVSFGAVTPSYDLEKEISETFPVDGVSEEALRAVLEAFVGEQDQVAPLFSAKSVDGVRAYEMARKLYKAGKPVPDDVLRSSRITVYGLELVSFTPGGDAPVVPRVAQVCGGCGTTSTASNRIHVADISGYDLPRAEILVDCSKGTYIRALARDLGEALGTGAFLHSLRRTRNGPYGVSEALTVEEIAAIFTPQEK